MKTETGWKIAATAFAIGGTLQLGTAHLHKLTADLQTTPQAREYEEAMKDVSAGLAIASGVLGLGSLLQARRKSEE